MKTKSILAFSLAAVMSLSMLAGCTKKEDDKTPSSSAPPPSSSAPAKAKTGQLKTIHEAVVAAYGENYTPMAVEETMIEEMYGVKKEWVKEIIAEAPMINVKVDTFIAVEAAEGKAQEVEDALNAYREKFLKEKEDFPYLADHLPKARAAQVVRIDDYVFYVMVGDIGDVEGDALEQQVKDEIQKGVDAINNTIEK